MFAHDLLLTCGDITDSPRNPRVAFLETVLARYVGILPRVVHTALQQRLDTIVSSADSVSDDIAREASHRLQSLFQEYEFPVPPREPSGLWVHIGLGWWTIVNRQAKAITTLCDAGLAAESIPNARTALEHTFALVLLSRHDETTVPDGVLRNMLNDLKRGVRSRPADEDPELVVILSALAEELNSTSDANWPERFKTHAERLGVYEETYSYYVGMCQLSHPTLGAVLANSDWLNEFRPIKEPSAYVFEALAGTPLLWAAQCQCWSALAVDRLLPDGLTWKDEAVRIGTDLSIPLIGKLFP